MHERHLAVSEFLQRQISHYVHHAKGLYPTLPPARNRRPRTTLP